jgi:hypothetical protein
MICESRLNAATNYTIIQGADLRGISYAQVCFAPQMRQKGKAASVFREGQCKRPGFGISRPPAKSTP